MNDNSPTFTSSGSFTVEENTRNVGTIEATDDDGDSITFSISGTDANEFNLVSNTGVLTLIGLADYESKNSYSIVITASDGVNSANQNVSVSVNDLNEAPSFTSVSSYSVQEGITEIGTITTSDPENNNITYSISGTDASSISVNSSTGALTFNSAPDYETKTSYSVTTEASDGVNNISRSIGIFIVNVNDVAPTFISNSSFTANENQTSIGTISATDAEGDTVTYSISGTDATSLSINSLTGVLSFVSAPDYETKQNYAAIVAASDGVNSTTQSLSITINDINEAPSIVLSSLSVNENSTSIGSISASDPEGDSITYSISGTDASSISVNSSTGALTFNSAPDYETKTSYSITATVTDGTSNASEDITISILDLDDTAPVFSSSTSFSVAELQKSIGTVQATDVDSTNISFSLQDNYVDSSSFTIDSVSGELESKKYLDYEDKDSYRIRVIADDGTQSTNQNIDISITDVNSVRKDLCNCQIGPFESGEYFGSAVDQNSTGRRIVVGSERAGTSILHGAVRIFNVSGFNDFRDWNSAEWVQFGQTVSGDTSKAGLFGYSVSMNKSGNIFAAGAPGNSDSNNPLPGYVRVYELDDGFWVQKGSELGGPSGTDKFGSSIQLNGDGTVLVVGARGHNSDAGLVRVFEWNGSDWVQRGADLSAGDGSNWFGYSVAIDEAGDSIVVGAPYTDDWKGAVRVYDWDGSNWNQRGDDLTVAKFYPTNANIDPEDGGEFGRSVDITDDGTRIAWSTAGNRGWLMYHPTMGINVYEWVANDWNRVGNSSLVQNNSPEKPYGWSWDGSGLELDSDGNSIAVRNPAGIWGGYNQSNVQVFDLNGTRWERRGLQGDIGGSLDGTAARGESLSISDDGMLLIFGAQGDINFKNGYVKPYVLSDPPENND